MTTTAWYPPGAMTGDSSWDRCWYLMVVDTRSDLTTAPLKNHNIALYPVLRLWTFAELLISG